MGTEVGRCLNLLLAVPTPARVSLIFAEVVLAASEVVSYHVLAVLKHSSIILLQMPSFSTARDRVCWMETRCGNTSSDVLLMVGLLMVGRSNFDMYVK